MKRRSTRPGSEHRTQLEQLARDCRRLAAQYSPKNEIPNVSRLDAGTADLLRSFGVELISAADLAQRFAAVWSRVAARRAPPRQRASPPHRARGFRAGRRHQSRGRPRESTSTACSASFSRPSIRRGCTPTRDPIVGVNAHCGGPALRFPRRRRIEPIRRGDFLLIDLWAKEKAAESVYADICWCGVCDSVATERQEDDLADRARRPRRRHRARAGALAGDADPRLRSGRRHAPGDSRRRLRRTFIPPHRPFDRNSRITARAPTWTTSRPTTRRRLIAMTGFSIEPGIYLPGRFRNPLRSQHRPDRRPSPK